MEAGCVRGVSERGGVTHDGVHVVVSSAAGGWLAPPDWHAGETMVWMRRYDAVG